jgi:hypothetical protein
LISFIFPARFAQGGIIYPAECRGVTVTATLLIRNDVFIDGTEHWPYPAPVLVSGVNGRGDAGAERASEEVTQAGARRRDAGPPSAASTGTCAR